MSETLAPEQIVLLGPTVAGVPEPTKTVTVAVVVPPQGPTAVTVSVYVVVTVGDAIGLGQVVQLNPVAGLQL